MPSIKTQRSFNSYRANNASPVLKHLSAPLAEICRVAHAVGMSPSTVHSSRSEGLLARLKCAAAFMSDTKWRKLFVAVSKAHTDIDQVEVKFIDTDESRQIRFPPSLACPLPYMDTIEYGPTAFRTIEWLEFPADVSRVLNQNGTFQVAVTGNRTRVLGYADPIPDHVR